MEIEKIRSIVESILAVALQPESIKKVRSLAIFELTEHYLWLASRMTATPLHHFPLLQTSLAEVQKNTNWLKPGDWEISDLLTIFNEKQETPQYPEKNITRIITFCLQGRIRALMRETESHELYEWLAEQTEDVEQKFPFIAPFFDIIEPVFPIVSRLAKEIESSTVKIREKALLSDSFTHHEEVLQYIQNHEIQLELERIYAKRHLEAMESWEKLWIHQGPSYDIENSLLLWLQNQSVENSDAFIRRYPRPSDFKEKFKLSSQDLEPFLLSEQAKNIEKEQLKINNQAVFDALSEISHHILTLSGEKTLTISILGKKTLAIDFDAFNRVGYSSRHIHLFYESLYHGLQHQGWIMIVHHAKTGKTKIGGNPSKSYHLYGLLLDRYRYRALTTEEVRMAAEHHFESNGKSPHEYGVEYRTFRAKDRPSEDWM